MYEEVTRICWSVCVGWVRVYYSLQLVQELEMAVFPLRTEYSIASGKGVSNVKGLCGIWRWRFDIILPPGNFQFLSENCGVRNWLIEGQFDIWAPYLRDWQKLSTDGAPAKHGPTVLMHVNSTWQRSWMDCTRLQTPTNCLPKAFEFSRCTSLVFLRMVPTWES